MTLPTMMMMAMGSAATCFKKEGHGFPYVRDKGNQHNLGHHTYSYPPLSSSALPFHACLVEEPQTSVGKQEKSLQQLHGNRIPTAYTVKLPKIEYPKIRRSPKFE